MKHEGPAPSAESGAAARADAPTRNRRVTFAAYGGPEVVRVVEEDSVPMPKAGEVRIRVEASSLVFTDMLIRRNLYPMRKTLPGEVLGYDLVGRVESRGPGTDGPQVGTRVAALTQVGGGQDWVCLPASAAVAVRGDLDPILIEPLVLSYMTAWQSLTRMASLKAGDSVLVIAASGAVGLAALDIARALGLRATGVASAARRELIESMGAEFVPYDKPEAARRLDEISKRFGGFAAILDGAASEPVAAHLRRLAHGGRYVGFGFTAHLRQSDRKATVLARLWAKLRLGLRFGTLLLRQKLDSRVRFYDIHGLCKSQPGWFRDDLAALNELLAAGRIAPHVAGVYRPERAAEAHQLIERGAVAGRLVLDLRLEA